MSFMIFLLSCLIVNICLFVLIKFSEKNKNFSFENLFYIVTPFSFFLTVIIITNYDSKIQIDLFKHFLVFLMITGNISAIFVIYFLHFKWENLFWRYFNSFFFSSFFSFFMVLIHIRIKFGPVWEGVLK